MRGTIYYQTAQLAEIVYSQGLSKTDQKESGLIANAETLQTYREIWNELGIYSKGMYGLKDMQDLSSEHIQSYMTVKSNQNITEQYFELISCAIGKLETALRRLNAKYATANPRYFEQKDRDYDFSVRHKILSEARRELRVKETSDDPKFCREYDDPKAMIEALDEQKFYIAARIQFESGARFDGVHRIDQYMVVQTRKLFENKLDNIVEYKRIDSTFCQVSQMQGTIIDPFTGNKKGTLFDVEKGGKPGLLYVSEKTYTMLEEYFTRNQVFIVHAHQYRRSLINAAKATNQDYQGTHGFRWNFARNRFEELQIFGNLTYEQALQQVSWEMKHERADITEHYLR